jgi:cytochrome c-type biogenesis protein CcmE
VGADVDAARPAGAGSTCALAEQPTTHAASASEAVNRALARPSGAFGLRSSTMKNHLDRELAEAISGDDDAPSSTPPVAAPPAPPAPRRRKNLGMLLSLLAMVAALTVFFFVGLKPAAIYAVPVDQLLAEQAKYVGRKVRLEGELVPGTLAKRDQPCEYRFRVHAMQQPGQPRPSADELTIRYPQCVIPDTFRDVPEGGVLVTVEGALDADKTFAATQVMAKCASKYDPKEHKMKSPTAAL